MIQLVKLFLIIIPIVYCQNDPCRFQLNHPILPSDWTYTSVDQVRLCFQSNPVNRTVIAETIKQLNNSMDFYSFLNLVRRSGSPYFTHVDIRHELDQIKNQSTYQNDYQFHMKVVETWNKLNDFHTRYTAPDGYARFNLLFPFIFEYDSNQNKVRIQRIVKIYSTLLQKNLTQYIGRVLTKINNVDRLTYLKDFAHEQSFISKDPVVKLNSVFRREFWLRNLAEHPLPDTDSLILSFESSENVTLNLPLLILITKKYNNRFEFQLDNSFSLTSNPVDIPNIFGEIFKIEDLQWYSKERSSNYQLMHAGQRTFYKRHIRSDTAILRLETFDQNYADEIKSIVTEAQGKNLILDLIGNEGGHSCLAYSLLHYLVPEYFDLTRLYEPMDARITKSLITFSSYFSAYPGSILDIETNSHFTDLQWIQPFVNRTRGPVVEEYSMKWSINCDSALFGDGQFWMRNQTRDKYFSSIYVLTDGTCGSACSLFLSKLKLASNFKRVYGLGGEYWISKDRLFESSSYAGGGAFPWNQIVLIHNSLTTDSSSTIDYLPTSARINVNVYELYINGVSREYPREFMKQPIDRRLSYGNYIDMQVSLNEIIKDCLKSDSIKEPFFGQPTESFQYTSERTLSSIDLECHSKAQMFPTVSSSAWKKYVEYHGIRQYVQSIGGFGISLSLFSFSLVTVILAFSRCKQPGFPTGTILIYSGTASSLISSTNEWLFCDGSTVSRIQYRTLFETIGVNYGSGNGIDTFNLPDLRTDFIRGTNLSTVAQMTSGGSTQMVVNIANLPSHSHSSGSLQTLSSGSHSHTVNDPGHNHGGSTGSDRHGPGSSSFGLFGSSSESSTHAHTIFWQTSGISVNANGFHTHTISGITGSVGNDQPVNKIPPYITMHYIIKI